MSIDNANCVPSDQTKSQLYRERDITSRGKFSKAHLYNMITRGEFPRQVITAPRFARWGREVDVWFADPAVWIAANRKSRVMEVTK
jgi:predicted DNA-binding transcriptional regulator AlpA